MQILEYTTLLLGFFLCSLGVYSDWKTRRFPNWIAGALLVVGLVYASLVGQIIEAILAFLLVNLLGIFFHKYRLVAAGDMKFVSLLFLFLNIMDMSQVLCFLGLSLVFGLGYAFWFCIQQNEGFLQKMKEGMAVSYASLLFRQPRSRAWETEGITETILENSMAMTLPFYLAFVGTMLLHIV